MAASEAQKKASAKYHREHISTISCRVQKAQAEQFRQYCESIGTTPNAVIKDYILNIISKETPGD